MASGYGMEAHEIILYAIETAYEAFEYWETNCE